VFCPSITRCRVPADLDTVTTVRPDEVSAGDVGMTPGGPERIWEAVKALYRSGLHPAIGLCVRRHGQVVLDRAIGHGRGNGPHDPPHEAQTLATPETPFPIFSASKAVTAMIIHLLDQRHLIHLDDPVCEYIPTFARGSKQWITIRHVLIHRAGIPTPPPEVMDLDHLDDPDLIVDILCNLPQQWRPGRQLAYHAVTGGFILGEVVRRVTGKDIRTVLDEELRRPLGFRWMNYGAAPEDVGRVAHTYFTGPPLPCLLAWAFRRALGVDFHRVIELSKDPRFHAGIIPSGNVVCTANELSRFFQLLLAGGTLDGVQIFEPRTVRRAVVEQSYLEIDFTLGLPFRYGLGFMLGAEWFSLYGPDTKYAFGHLGFTNVIGWADPERQVAAALVTSGKPVIYPEIYYLWDVLRQIGTACPKVGNGGRFIR
jgi:CubicO group peptidase (beta-lactamase class C family)